jgi:hypothetical protein
MITSDDFNELINNFNPNPMHSKVERKRQHTTHHLKCTDYDSVFVLSDLHADFEKFVQILKQNNLIRSSDFVINEDTDEKTIYEHYYKTVEEAKWIAPKKTALLILGDLVDGFRGEIFSQLNDPLGCFEVLIHALIHNLRIQAQEKMSIVLFTIGNHDMDCIITMDEKKMEYMYDTYCHPEAKGFFGFIPDPESKAMLNRRNFLLPFYQNCPFLFVEFVHEENVQVVCVHAGIHGKTATENLLEKWRPFQEQINKDGGLTEENIVNIDIANSEVTNSILWNRNYFEHAVCPQETEPVVIVGHCITTDMDMSSDKSYDGCDSTKNLSEGRGCVYVGCYHQTTPKVIFVDTALSRAFRYKTNNETRDVEILKLQKSTAGNPYYYTFHRQLNGIVLDPPLRPPQVVSKRTPPLPPLISGGKKQKRKTRHRPKKRSASTKKWRYNYKLEKNLQMK